MSALPNFPTATDGASRFARAALSGLAAQPKRIDWSDWSDLDGDAAHTTGAAADDEMKVLARCAPLVARTAGRGASVIELGPGSARQMPLLLAALDAPAVCRHARDVAALAELPPARERGRRLVYCPGVEVVHRSPRALGALLTQLADLLGPEALLLVGADATRDPAAFAEVVRNPVQAALHKNLLVRINRELESNFALDAFRHDVHVDAAERRVDTRLVAEYTQRVRLPQGCVHFSMGEPLHTGSRWMFSPIRFQSLAWRAGWAPIRLWADDDAPRFAMMLLERKPAVCRALAS